MLKPLAVLERDYQHPLECCYTDSHCIYVQVLAYAWKPYSSAFSCQCRPSLTWQPFGLFAQVLLAYALGGCPAFSLVVLASDRNAAVSSKPELVELPAGSGKGEWLLASVLHVI